MLKIPSWFFGSVSRPLGALARRACAVAAVFGLALGAAAQSVQFSSALYGVSENAGSIRIAVTRLGDKTVPVSVTATASDGSAQSGFHYVQRTVTLSFRSNEVHKTFDLVILDNGATNDTKTINLTLSNPVGATIGIPGTALIEITDEETGVNGIEAGIIDFNARVYSVTDSEGTDAAGRFYPGASQVLNAEGALITVVRRGGARGRVLVDYETVPLASDWIGPWAREWTNYIPVSGTLALSDYQMSAQFLVPIVKYDLNTFFSDALFNLNCIRTNDAGGFYELNPACPPTSDRYWPFFTFLTNQNDISFIRFYSLGTPAPAAYTQPPAWRFQVRLSNVRPDPAEDPAVIRPLLGSTNTADVRIVFVDNFRSGNTISASGFFSTGFSFERAHYWTDETAHIYNLMVNRDGRIDGSTVVHYQVNNRSSPTLEGDHQLNNFFGHAGSDYAQPFVDYLPPTTDAWSAATGEIDGTIRWSQVEFGPKPAEIPIIADNLVEFSEDLVVDLVQLVGEAPNDGGPPRIQFPPTDTSLFGIIDDFYDAGTRAVLTIVYDNIYDWIQTTNGWIGGEQAAGALDRRWNRDNEMYIVPPVNLIPGANSTVQAVAVQADGRLILGGEFTSVNTFTRRHLARMTPAGQIDKEYIVGTGTDAAVTAIAIQSDGKALIGGPFTSYNGRSRNGLARINIDGSLDDTFNPGLGANGPVNALSVASDGKITVGGEFTVFNGNPQNFLVRLNPNGSVDDTFNVGTGPNDAIYAIATTSMPKIIELNDRLVDRVAQRFDIYDVGSSEGTIFVEYDMGGNSDTLDIIRDNQVIGTTGQVGGAGTLSVVLAPGGSTYITVAMNRAQALQSYAASWSYKLTINPTTDNRPIIVGRFTSINGTPRNRVARLNLDGSVDQSFSSGFGSEDGVVYSVVKHGRKSYVGGSFSFFDRLNRNRIVGLNEDGSVDVDFQPGTGFNDIVYSLIVDSAGKAIAGGLFTEFNGSRRLGLARLKHNGKLDSTFMDTAYNQFAGLPNIYSFEPENFIRSMSFQRTTNSYSVNITNVVDSVTNVTVRTFTMNEDLVYVGGSFQRVGGGFRRNDVRPRLNVARIMGGVTEGPGTIELKSDTYFTDENSGTVFITAQRDDGHLGAASGRFATADLDQGPGAATLRQDYQPFTLAPSWISRWDETRQITEAFRGPNNEQYLTPFQDPGTLFRRILRDLLVQINDDVEQEGDEDLELTLRANPTTVSLQNEPIPMWPASGRDTARLTIVDNDFTPGVISFAEAQYFVGENSSTATITLVRENGSVGVVSVDYRTVVPAVNKADPWNSIQRVGDYDSISIRTISFGPGQTVTNFTVNIRPDSFAETDENVGLQLLNPTGGATIGQRNATLVIIDDDFAAGRMGLTTNSFNISEGSGVARIVVKRLGGSQGSSQVTVTTSDDTARAGIDYVATTKVLTWSSGNIEDKVVEVPLIDQNTVDGARRFKVTLSNPLVNSAPEPAAIGNQRELFVNILDNDNYGNLRFSQPVYVTDENSGKATVTVIRVNGLVGEMTVNYSATAQLAIPGQDFVEKSGTLTFTNNQRSATFDLEILDDASADGNKTILLDLANQAPGALGTPSANVILTIIDNELENIPAGTLDSSFLAEGANDFIYTLAQQIDGRLLLGGDFSTVNSVTRNRLARIFSDGTLDSTFSAGAGPNNSVRALQVQEDGRILIAGAFTSVGPTNRNYIARLNPGGAIDQTFDPGAGANNPIYAMILQPDGKVVIGGNFSAYGPTQINGIARLNDNGTLDNSFKTGTGAAGPVTYTVYAIAQQLDGKLLVGGDFEFFNNTPRKRLVRLNLDGSVDTSFDMSVGANDSVRAIAVQPDGRILVGGIFTSLLGQPVNRIARLNEDGTFDSTFNTAGSVPQANRGATGPVLAIAIQLDGKIVISGDFSQYNGVTRRGITRLNSDGTTDPTINFGTGVNGTVAALVVQPDRKIVLGGGFTEYNGQPRLRLARINGGTIAGSGRFEFASAGYTVSEASTNVTVTVRRMGGTTGTVRMNFTTQADPSAAVDARAIENVDYTKTTGTLEFAEGETQGTFKVQITNDEIVEGEEVFNVAVSDLPGQPSRLGDQPTARVVIVSDDSEIFFGAPAFSVGESIASGNATLTISRIGSVSVPVSVDFTTSDGTAITPADYTGVTMTVTFAVGESTRTISIPVVSDQLVEGNEFVNLALSNPTVGGILRAGGATSRLIIVDDDFAPGEIQFASAAYTVREGSPGAEVAVIRTNGLTGTVTVRYNTERITANPGTDYTDVSGILTFNDGEGLKFIQIPIANDDAVENNETVNIRLFSVTGGASLGLSAATLTIIDDDLGSGSLDTTFDPGSGANGTVRAIRYDSRNHFLLGGDFTAFNGDVSRSRVVRLQRSGQVDGSYSVVNTPNNSVAALELQPDGRVLIGGAFSSVENQIENRVARLQLEGALDTSFALPLGLNAQVSSIAVQGDGKVLIGGVFTSASAAARNHIARLNSNGSLDITFDPGNGADNNVNAIALQGEKILIGGAFGSVNGVGAGRIARLNANGTVDTSFRTGTGFNRADGRPPMVHDIIVLADGRILVAGDFTSYNGTPRAGIAKLSADGALVNDFASTLLSVNGAIRTMAIQLTDRARDEKILIGGDFTAVDGTARGRVARLDATGKFDPSFDPGDGANDSVLDIFVQPWDGRVVMVGAFTQFNNNPNFRGIARLNNDKAFLPNATPIVLGSPTLSAGGLRITFAGEPGVLYVIEGSNDFIIWSVDRTIEGNGPNTTVEIPTGSAGRYFRVRPQ